MTEVSPAYLSTPKLYAEQETKNMQIQMNQEFKIMSNIHPPNLDSSIFNADHPRLLDDVISVPRQSCHGRRHRSADHHVVAAQRPALDMADAFMTPITRPSPSCGIAPQLVARGIAPQTTFTSRRRPPTHMESAAPPLSLWIDKALIPSDSFG
jgi:hypothetical protein